MNFSECDYERGRLKAVSNLELLCAYHSKDMATTAYGAYHSTEPDDNDDTDRTIPRSRP